MEYPKGVGERASGHRPIPVLRPKLPVAAALLPYLERIDDARIYSNFGPLARELQARLGGMLRGAEADVVCMGSGTSALTAAVLAHAGAGRDGSVAILPDFTFAATAAGIQRCGYSIHLADVDEKSWQLDPEALSRHPRLAEVALVVPVATFGRPVAQEPWVEFSRTTGIPVVIDGAASLASILRAPDRFVGDVPTVLSFHATKSFGVGEGGCVIWNAAEAEQRLTQASNFGFFQDRVSVAQSLNAKMSEYHAAIGLAELDGWPAKAENFQRANDHYRRHAEELDLSQRLVLFPEVDYIYPQFACADEDECRFLARELSGAGIDSRLWYSGGLRTHPEYSRCSADELPTSKSLAGRLLGLPMAVDLGDGDACRILDVLAAALQRRAREATGVDARQVALST